MGGIAKPGDACGGGSVGDPVLSLELLGGGAKFLYVPLKIIVITLS